MAMTRTIRIRRPLPAALTLFVALASASALPSAAQPSVASPGTRSAAALQPAPRPIEELIRTDVEQLRATGDLDLGGVMIASRIILPRIYEARAFAPTWRTQAQIDSLLETI